MKFVFEYFSYSVYLGCIYICCVNHLCDINAEPYNIALGKPTDQGPADYCGIPKGCCTSDLAVDGDFDQDVKNGHCSQTTGSGTIQGSWWSVDFQGHYLLAWIRILRRSNAGAGCCSGRMDGVSIKGKPGDQTIFNDGFPFYVGSETDISITVPESLSDIKFSGIHISVPGSFLTLCEVQVYLVSGRSCGINFPTLTNGNWTSANAISDCYFYGCSYTGNCATGYTQSGSATITTTCSENGSWTTPVGRCLARSCGSSLPPMSNGNWISRDTDVSCYYYTCSYRFFCETGYFLRGTNPILTYCGSDGKWTTPEGACQVRFCSSNLPTMSNGIWTPRNARSCYYYRCSYAFSCAQGYNNSGTDTIITSCSSVGIWTTPAGSCQAIECPILNGNHTNYVVTSSLDRTTYNTELTAVCLNGYELSSGDLNRTCLINGTWSGTEPNCTIIACTRPQYEGMNYIIKNKTTKFIYKDLLASQCIEGFELSMGNLTRYCLASGEWSGDTPHCTAARSCGNNLPNVSNSYRLSLNATGFCYYIGCVYIFSCKRGYIQSGMNPITSTCIANGIWTAPVDNCREVSPTYESQTSGLTAVTGGLVGAGTVLLIGLACLVAAVICVLLRRKRDKSNTDDLYETRLKPDEPRLYSVLDETVRTATVDAGETEQISDTVVNTEYEICEEIKQTNQEYSNLQI